MNFLIFSEDKTLDRYGLVIELLKKQGYNYIQSSNHIDILEVTFDFLIIDEGLIHGFKDIKTPFIVCINNKSENKLEYENKNCKGFINLDSNPLILLSTLNLIFENILDSDYEYKNKTIKDYLSDSDLTLFKTLPQDLVFQDRFCEILDISQEKEKQNKLKLLSLAFEHSPLSIFITDKDGLIELINPKMIEMTGYSSKSLIGQNPRMLQSENSITDYINLWETINSGSVWNGEFLNKKQNGDEYYESAIIAPVFNDKKEITNFVALKEDVTNVKVVTKELEKTLLSMEEIVKERTKSLRSAQSLTLESLATLSEYRDNETGAHIQRTKLYVKFVLEKIKEHLDYSDDEIIQLWSSAPLHDIGKVAISDSILLKPGKLTVEEFNIMKKHPLYGNEALMRVSERKDDDSFLRFAKEITLYHHEKWDGSGYPYGLSGEDIPISARLMALADVYDALRSVRPYKQGFSHEKAVNMILEQDGKHFDPKLIKVFKEYNQEFNKIFNESIDYEIIFQSML